METTGTAALFERLAQRYDAWYDGPVGRALFPLEVGCLAPLLARSDPPRLEIGVGSGRFAAELAAGIGLDPAAATLRLARARGAERGHPFYSSARFLTHAQVAGLLAEAGMTVAARSTLLQPPSENPHPEPIRDTDHPEAGFVAWQARPGLAPARR
jgi:SAM-dependent methyltransferase